MRMFRNDCISYTTEQGAAEQEDEEEDYSTARLSVLPVCMYAGIEKPLLLQGVLPSGAASRAHLVVILQVTFTS